MGLAKTLAASGWRGVPVGHGSIRFACAAGKTADGKPHGPTPPRRTWTRRSSPSFRYKVRRRDDGLLPHQPPSSPPDLTSTSKKRPASRS